MKRLSLLFLWVAFSASLAFTQTTEQSDFLIGSIGQENASYSLSRIGTVATETTYQWTQPGNAGNTGGTSTTPHGTFTWTPGDPAVIAISPAGAYDNYFWYMRLPLPSALPTHLSQSLNITMTAADRAVSQAVEFQLELTWQGETHNMALQACFKGCGTSGAWRYFDFNNKVWIALPAIPLPDFTVGAAITSGFSLTSSTTTHDYLVVNGVKYAIAVTQPSTATTHANKYTVAYQMDTDSAGDSYSTSLGGVLVRHTF